MTLPFPMPNDVIEDKIVVASAQYIDDERGSIALVLLLTKVPPFFAVALYAQTDIADDKGFRPYKAGEAYVIGQHWNIVPAVREYEQSGGDY